MFVFFKIAWSSDFCLIGIFFPTYPCIFLATDEEPTENTMDRGQGFVLSVTQRGL